MSLSDFLFQGAPPPSVTQYGTKTEGLPQWLSDYTQSLLSKANAVAAEPYQAYGGPRIADFTGDQQNAFTQTRTAANAFQPDFNNARGQFGQATQYSASGASSPFINAAARIDAMGQTQPFMQGAMASSTAAAQPYAQRAAGINAINAASPFINRGANASGMNAANPFINQAARIDAMGQAQPFMNQAGQTFPGQVQNYMNPYTDQVVDRIGDLGARNLSEKLMPAIGDQFIRAGQMGSSRHMGEVGKALRDTQESTLAAQSQALERGFGQAGQLFNQDASRMAGLAGTAGNLALGQAGQMSSLGQLAGNLQNQDASRQLQAGQSMGQLSLGQAGQFGQLGQMMGGLSGQDASRMGNLAGQMGNLALGQQGALGQLGQLAGNMQSVDAGNTLRAGEAFSSLGQRQQAAGLTGAAALDAVGQQQQRLGQANLDLAYQDFQNQRDYPQNQLGFMSNIVRGVPYSQSSTTSQTGFAPAYQPSGLSQISGALSMYNALGSR